MPVYLSHSEYILLLNTHISQATIILIVKIFYQIDPDVKGEIRFFFKVNVNVH